MDVVTNKEKNTDLKYILFLLLLYWRKVNRESELSLDIGIDGMFYALLHAYAHAWVLCNLRNPLSLRTIVTT